VQNFVSNELFGRNCVVDCIQKANGPPWGKILLDAVNAWQKNTDASDDLTILEIWRDLL